MPDDLAIEEQAGHEITAWRLKPFIIGVISFFVFMILIFLVLGAVTGAWTHGAFPAEGQATPPQATPRWNREAPELQVNPGMDLIQLRKVENARLHTLRWSDGTHAFACIPIEQAMSLVAQATAEHRSILPAPRPATPLDLQNQKSQTLVNPADAPNPAPPPSQP